jgi:hypothetical protein
LPREEKLPSRGFTGQNHKQTIYSWQTIIQTAF